MLLDAATTMLDVIRTYVLPFVPALIIIVFVHELGHFLVGRWCGVKVETFSIGFGQELFGWNDRRGTRWRFAAIPLGGYVKFEGDLNAASFPDQNAPLSPTSYPAQPVWKRMAIVIAGPAANFLLAIGILTFAFSYFDDVQYEPRIDSVIAGGAAEAAGIRAGDFVRKIDGKEMPTYLAVQQYVFFRPGEELTVTIDRNGEVFDVKATLGKEKVKDNFGGTINAGRLGITHDSRKAEAVSVRHPVGKAFQMSLERTWFAVTTTFRVLKRMIVGEETTKIIGGPISIAKATGDAVKSGLAGTLQLLAMISISIGLINLFPIPMLDGGHLVFYTIEAIRGKPLGPAAQEWGMRIGLSFVVLLMVFGTMNDFVRIGSMF